jgi:long-chain acyl-CoA synthetase
MMKRVDGSAVWVPETTLAILQRAVAKRPDNVALICGERSLTYAEYGESVSALAGRLVKAGVAGNHVVILLRNSIEICIAIFAGQAAGAATVTLNPDYTTRELEPMFADTKPVVTITHEDLVGRLEGLEAGMVWSIETLDKLPPAALKFENIAPDDIALIQFTGGTTGRPKGVMLSHRAVATNVAQREAVLPTQFGDERILCTMPLFHSFASAMGLHLAAYTAGTLVILPRYRPDWVIDAIDSHGITRFPAGPTVFASLLNFEGLTRARVASLRCAYSGSAPLPLETLTRWEMMTGVPIYEGYGQSEAGPILTYHGPDMALKPRSVGPALPGTQIEIVGGNIGEIRARGPQIMAGYLNQPDATVDALRDGWLHTGDIGRIDAEGYVFIEDRKKDMAIVGGYNVYPREIDEVLLTHPQIVEAAAVGVPDAYRGEIIWAFVVSDLADDDIMSHCAASLVKYKHPSVVRRLATLPKTSVGKVDKQALKMMAKDQLYVA